MSVCLSGMTQIDLRHTALIVSELARYKIDIAAFSETRLASKGEAKFFFPFPFPFFFFFFFFFFLSRCAPDDKHKAAIGYAIKTSLIGKLACPLKGVTDYLMTMKLPLHHRWGGVAAIISAYATTKTTQM